MDCWAETYVFIYYYSRYQSQSKDYALFRKARKFERAHNFEDAANAFIEAAEYAATQKMPYFKAVARYQQAAKCFLRLKDSRAIICFQKSIDAFLKDYRYKQAIERLFVYGYLCQREFPDGVNGKEFYKKAEELSLKYKKTHSCVITKFDESEYDGNYEKALDDHQKFFVIIREHKVVKYTQKSFCRNCVEAFHKLSDHIFDPTRMKIYKQQRDKQ
ncbi:hypothetical protein RF11_01020 [Thelohanellus kitauei]|uniref:Alpha-soluble NSF attachment protein n=1 Tax=Thelohanellus kitauei TaxID=669202 RepID=A0A0C2N5W4_THEKT|nr:hypothetical protein RF11_01020 [Thelohanellus kitauei]